MRRRQWIELEDLRGLPLLLREAGMAYLRFAAELTGQARQIAPLIEAVLERSGEREILDLCSGGAGPAVAIAKQLSARGRPLRITLTDRFPDAGARRLLEAAGDGLVHYQAEPVDALAVERERPGLRTLFNAFHHFPPAQARQVLATAVSAGRPIAVVEVMRRRPLALLGMLLVPFAVLLSVPLLRPFRPGWLVFTYLVPAVPLLILWDGLVSCLRIYEPAELRELAAAADPDDRFEWRIEEIAIRPAPLPAIALLGIPRQRAGRPR